MPDDLVTVLLPVLGRSLDKGFNVFDVMHHGLHEKQISNVFRWLLDSAGTHNFGDRFVRIFVDEVTRDNEARGLPRLEGLPNDGYWVRQEVNTSAVGDEGDIADLVLESKTTRLVVENYFTSDGHGHNYDAYLQYAQRDGLRGAVVLLCRDENSALQTLGWENASVVTYRKLVQRLHDALDGDLGYQRSNPEAYSFVEQMYRKFVKGGGLMDDHDVLGFIAAMCATGEAHRYRGRADVAAELFASDLAEQARERFDEGRQLLQRVKAQLKSFGLGPLARQLDETLGVGFVTAVSATYAGIFQWTVNLDFADRQADSGVGRHQLKFGPSAWFANEQDPGWKRTVDPAVADYSRLFLTDTKAMEVRQSDVTLKEVLDGLEPTDHRLHDEMVQLLNNDR